MTETDKVLEVRESAVKDAMGKCGGEVAEVLKTLFGSQMAQDGELPQKAFFLVSGKEKDDDEGESDTRLLAIIHKDLNPTFGWRFREADTFAIALASEVLPKEELKDYQGWWVCIGNMDENINKILKLVGNMG